MVVNHGESPLHIRICQSRPPATCRQPTAQPDDHRIQQRQVTKAFDQRPVVERRAAEVKALNFHPEEPGQHGFARRRNRAQRIFQRGERYPRQPAAQSRRMPDPESESDTRPQHFLSEPPRCGSVLDRHVARILQHQQAEKQPAKPARLSGRLRQSRHFSRRIDAISQRLTGFFIGRYDVRFSSEADVRAGKNFQIIELNGAASEATSIYDSRNSIFAAYRTLFRQWDWVFAIGAANRKRGCTPTKLSLVWQTWRKYSRMATSYPMAD
jgi:hypothetical protein